MFPFNVSRSNSHPSGLQTAGCSTAESGQTVRFPRQAAQRPERLPGGQQAGLPTSEARNLRPVVAAAAGLAPAEGRVQPPNLQALNVSEQWRQAVLDADPDRQVSAQVQASDNDQNNYDNAWMNAFPRSN